MYFYFENRDVPFSASCHRGLTANPHLHNDIEIIVVLSGESLATADSKSAVIKEGDIYISFPNQIHFYHDRTALDHVMLIFSPDLIPEFGSLLDGHIPSSPVVKNAGNNPKIKKSIEELIRLYEEGHPFSEALSRAHILIIMSELFSAMTLEKAPKYPSNILKLMIKYCYSNYNHDISLQDLADELHTSRYYISHLFSKKLNISFNNYINTLRVRQACELLKQNSLSVTDIGFSVGFNSTRSFNRCFRNILGITPKEYRSSYKNLSIDKLSYKW